VYTGLLPSEASAGIFSLVVLFTGTFGSAVGLARLKDGRMIERLAVLPLSPRAVIADYLLANVVIDGLQLMTPLTLIAWHLQADPFFVLASFILALISANALGAMVAVASRSQGDVHIYAALAVAGAGLISWQSHGAMPVDLDLASPFHLLSGALLSSMPDNAHMPFISLISAGILLLATLLMSSRLSRLD
jgi:hypothetical protein